MITVCKFTENTPEEVLQLFVDMYNNTKNPFGIKSTEVCRKLYLHLSEKDYSITIAQLPAYSIKAEKFLKYLDTISQISGVKEEMNKQRYKRYYLDISTPQSKILSFVAKYNTAIKEKYTEEDINVRLIDEISFQYLTFRMFKEQLEVFSGCNIDASDYLDYIKEVK